MRRLPADGRLVPVSIAATEIFGCHGYRGTRTADVAARAGMSAGSLYTYVESKEALFHLVFIYGLGLLACVHPTCQGPLRKCHAQRSPSRYLRRVLVGDAGCWMAGQIFNSESGFRR